MDTVPGRNRTGHGGNIHAVLKETGESYGAILDFSANINPMGPPEWLRPLISRELEKLQHYPDPEYKEFVQSVADFYQVDPATVVPANGSTDLLYILPRILGCRRALIPVPSYIDYIRAAEHAGLEVKTLTLPEQDDFQLPLKTLSETVRTGDLVILATPNNPTGATVDLKHILAIAADFPDSYFLIDEAFLDFIPGAQSVGGKGRNILTMNSMTKFFGVPGLRLGFGIFPVDVAERVRHFMPPWTLNSLAQSVGIRALADRRYQEASRRLCCDLREQFVTSLQQFNELRIYPGEVNYLLIRLKNGMSAAELARKLLSHGILIRCCDNYLGLDESYFRVAVRTHTENMKLVAALQDVFGLKNTKSPSRKTKKTPALMFQGTSSNAGKSVLTAALCRILLQDGLRVAPFKAQNMSLNSFVTLQGEEMGRAQVVQAQAAKLDPDVRMNPVLLKPNSDTGSQIIVQGHPVGNMTVNQYSSYKPKAWQAVCESYDSLAGDFEAIILEGAGSPGEVNLKNDDIVNMRMARYSDAPVLLVGDIDRGGVYASFVGTMEVLAEWERQLIAGFVVNRFRGQASLLDSAHEYVMAHTGRGTLGVIPYIHGLGLPEEDSVSFKEGIFNNAAPDRPHVSIAVINFPHISNFTDVEPFLAEPDVHLQIVNRVEDIGDVDAIILPGSKNVIGDLRFVQDKGFADVIRKKAAEGCEIIGICGGYQVLGRKICDPHGIESSIKQITGLELLDINTELKAEKTLVRQNGTHLESGQPVSGYEIHHGSSSTGLPPVLTFAGGSHCGARAAVGSVWGTYLHGIFDSDSYRRWFIDNLREKKGLAKVEKILAPYDLEIAFDRLADNVRQNLDMDAVYSLLGV